MESSFPLVFLEMTTIPQVCHFIHVCKCRYTYCATLSPELPRSEKENGVDDVNVESEEDEFSHINVEDSSSYLEQLDSEVSHLVWHPQKCTLALVYIVSHDYNMCLNYSKMKCWKRRGDLKRRWIIPSQ